MNEVVDVNSAETLRIATATPVATTDVPPATMARVEEQVVHLVKRTRSLWRVAAASVSPDLQPIGYRMLSHLVREGPSNPGRLVDLMETDKSVISRQARLLEELGLMSVDADPQDGRCRVFSATERAHEVMRQARARASERLGVALGQLSATEVAEFASLLERVNAGFAHETPALPQTDH